MITIGYDAKRAFKNFTGLGNYSRSVIETMAVRYPDNEYVLYTPPYKARATLSFAAHNNIRIVTPKGGYRLLNSYWRSFKLARLIKKDRIDIFHGLSHELPAEIKQSGAKSVVTMHDLIILRYPELYKAIDRKIYIKKYRYACNNADLIIAISEQTRADLVDLMGVDKQKIRIAYQGCDPQFYSQFSFEQKQAVRQKYNLPERYILNVGTIEPRKNLLTLIKALPKVDGNIHLVCVGKPTDYVNVVQAVIKKSGLQARVHFLHHAAFADLPGIYQMSEVFVYPSLFEGFGIPILEALNSQVPVIAADTSSLPEVGGDAALYFEAEDDGALAQTINRILNSGELRNDMIEKGRRQVLKFREEQIAPVLWDIYSELMTM